MYLLGIDLASTGAFGIVGVCANLPKKLAAGLLATFIFDGGATCGLSAGTGIFAGALGAVLDTFEGVILVVVVVTGAGAAGLASFNLKLGLSSFTEYGFTPPSFSRADN